MTCRNMPGHVIEKTLSTHLRSCSCLRVACTAQQTFEVENTNVSKLERFSGWCLMFVSSYTPIITEANCAFCNETQHQQRLTAPQHQRWFWKTLTQRRDVNFELIDFLFCGHLTTLADTTRHDIRKVLIFLVFRQSHELHCIYLRSSRNNSNKIIQNKFTFVHCSTKI